MFLFSMLEVSPAESAVKEKTGKKLFLEDWITIKITCEISMEEFIFPHRVFSRLVSF